MASISYSPSLPVPQRPTTVYFGLTQSGSNFIRVWCTIAPAGSELDNRINSLLDPRNRVVFFEGEPSQFKQYTFDKGGKYTFVAQEYLKGDGYGGGYEGDPNGIANEVKKGGEATLTVHVGQRGTQPIGPPGNQAELVLWVWDNTIQRTTLAFHGENSPAIVAASPTPKVKTAIDSAAVDAALEALIGETVPDVLGDMPDLVNDIMRDISFHVASDVVHDSADTYNGIARSWRTAYGPTELPKAVNEAIKKLNQHYVNDTGVADEDGVFGPDSGSWHEVSGTLQSDRTNVPLYTGVGSYAEAYGALADLHRSLAAHQENSDVHLVTGSTVSDPPLLMAVHIAFLTVLAATNPVVPPAQSQGMQLLISSAGFKES